MNRLLKQRVDCCADATVAQLVPADVDEPILTPILPPTVLYYPVIACVTHQQNSMVDGSASRTLIHSRTVTLPSCGTDCDSDWSLLQHLYYNFVSGVVFGDSCGVGDGDEVFSGANTVVVGSVWIIGELFFVGEAFFYGLID